jgi:serine/threonine protein kinase
MDRFSLADFSLVRTIGTSFCSNNDAGTGTFGRVYLTRYRNSDSFFAMKCLKKVDIVRLKQVEHVNSERRILSQISFPFIVKL